LRKKKEKIAEGIDLSFASMVKGYPFTTFPKNQSNRFLFLEIFGRTQTPFYLQNKTP
jgi:hypothetical protein